MPPVESQQGLRFQVRYSDGKLQTLLVDAERALVGSAAYCEIRVPPEDAAPEHLEVVAYEGRVRATVRDARARVLLNGVPFETGDWPSGKTITIGDAIALAVDVVPLGQKTTGRSPLWWFLVVPIVGSLVSLFVANSRPSGSDTIPEAPPLFDAAVTTCPVAQPDAAAAYGAERLRLGLDRRERMPFDRKDGVAAVPLLETAAGCFTLAGEEPKAQDAIDMAKDLRRRLEEEYKIRRVRLEHAYRTGDVSGARRELTILIAMTSHRQTPYTEWLAQTARAADLALEAAGPPGGVHL